MERGERREGEDLASTHVREARNGCARGLFPPSGNERRSRSLPPFLQHMSSERLTVVKERGPCAHNPETTAHLSHSCSRRPRTHSSSHHPSSRCLTRHPRTLSPASPTSTVATRTHILTLAHRCRLTDGTMSVDCPPLTPWRAVTTEATAPPARSPAERVASDSRAPCLTQNPPPGARDDAAATQPQPLLRSPMATALTPAARRTASRHPTKAPTTQTHPKPRHPREQVHLASRPPSRRRRLPSARARQARRPQVPAASSPRARSESRTAPPTSSEGPPPRTRRPRPPRSPTRTRGAAAAPRSTPGRLATGTGWPRGVAATATPRPRPTTKTEPAQSRPVREEMSPLLSHPSSPTQSRPASQHPA